MRVWGIGLGFRLEGLGFWVLGVGYRVGFRVQGSGLGVWGLCKPSSPGAPGRRSRVRNRARALSTSARPPSHRKVVAWEPDVCMCMRERESD
jgi:hypothetical protein